MPTADIDAAVDNDVLIKSACYGLQDRLMHRRSLGVLGAARYVVRSRINRMELAGDRGVAADAATALLDAATALEPNDHELALAAAIEQSALRLGLALDNGESQLAAIVIVRDLEVLETGDKRAIRGFEVLLDDMAALEPLTGRLRCLEQIVLGWAKELDADELAAAICSEPGVDGALGVCCRCYSPPPHGVSLDEDGFNSYIDDLRSKAPRVLVP